MFNVSPMGLVILIGCLLVSIVVHEYMHALVGYKLGDTTAHDAGRISFNPLRHIDPIMTIALPIITVIIPPHMPFLAAKPVPFDPGRVRNGEYGAAMIAAAGPLSNLVMAFMAAIVMGVTGAQGLVGEILTIFAYLNVALFVFNLIPIPPLDGSRVLYAFAPEPLQDLMRQIEQFGFILVMVLAFSGVIGAIVGPLNQLVLGWLPGF